MGGYGRIYGYIDGDEDGRKNLYWIRMNCYLVDGVK